MPPEEEEFQTKVSALYSIAYTVKNMYKRKGRDFAIPKLERLWWVESDKPPAGGPSRRMAMEIAYPHA